MGICIIISLRTSITDGWRTSRRLSSDAAAVAAAAARRQRVTHDGGQQIDHIRERAPARWLSIISWPTPRHAVPPKSMRCPVGRSVCPAGLSSQYRTTRDPQISCDSPGRRVRRSSVSNAPRLYRRLFTKLTYFNLLRTDVSVLRSGKTHRISTVKKQLHVMSSVWDWLCQLSLTVSGSVTEP